MNAAFESLTGLTLLEPAWLLLALLVLAVFAAALRRRPPSIVFAPGALAGAAPGAEEELPRTWRVRLVTLPRMLQALGLLLVVVALARPVRRDRLPLETEGIDILLALDVSSSMRTEDLDARRTRLEVARDAAARFVAGRPSDRIGLVTFARFPDVVCPPTLDHDALAKLLSRVALVESDGPEDATGIGTAVARAAQALRTSRAGSKVVILLTDGEENVAGAGAPGEIAPSHAAQLCAELSVRVYTIAAGAGGAPGDRAGPGARRAERLSERTGGRFFAARDAAAVAGVYASIDALEKIRIDEPRYRIEERFAPLLTAALSLLLGGVLLRVTVLDVLP